MKSFTNSIFKLLLFTALCIGSSSAQAQVCTSTGGGAWGPSLFSCTGGSSLNTASEIIINHAITITGQIITLTQEVHITIASGGSLTIEKNGSNDGRLVLSNTASTLLIASGGAIISGTGGSNNIVQIGSMQYIGTNFSTYSSSAPTLLTATGLPIELISFDGVVADNGKVTLYFSTASERNNDHFEIERSNNGVTFEKTGEIKGAGDSYVQQDYQFRDERPIVGTNYYRLRQVDYDEYATYSAAIMVSFGKKLNITLAPTPVAEQMVVNLNEPISSNGIWQVYDITGRELFHGTVSAETYSFNIDASTLAKGVYTLRVLAGQDVEVKQFMKR